MEIRRVCSNDYTVLKIMAIGILEPLYGDQSKSLREWFTGEGFKHAFVLASEKETGGFLSVKTNPTKPYLKISTLLIFEGHKKQGYGKKLLAKAIKIAKALEYRRLKVTVSESKQESLSFFIKAGFVVVDRLFEKYKPNSTEIILEMDIK